ncbi:hypothetical protein L1987_13013 [Smallanthus sonchifolius]|uniref:Uncharacterized protein n=1 Tax=Smallanthus sonchifolius TaxID=185202 RepID=A0ACB9JFB4_9ASTR|nr:hypothetical protein L1987_13013 [Smallanthus sonchifolius]
MSFSPVVERLTHFSGSLLNRDQTLIRYSPFSISQTLISVYRRRKSKETARKCTNNSGADGLQPRRVTQVPDVIIVGDGVAGAALACTPVKVKSLISGKNVHNDRFIRLQNFIKQCDGSDHRENIQLLLRLSSSERYKPAVELEKRAIQLTIEEGKEMQRMQALNILGKPSITRNPIPLTKHTHHNN